MAYSSFKKLKVVCERFNVTLRRERIFGNTMTMPIQPTALLLGNLAAARKLGAFTEKERSERLVHPILTEITLLNYEQITLYSGQELNINSSLGLNGECDYLLSWGKKVIEVVESPIFSVVEAKKQDMEHGLAQCTAQMLGAKMYNEKDNVFLPCLYGATTEGTKWQFVKLENNVLTIHEEEHNLSELPILLGFLQMIVEDIKKISTI